MDAPRNGITSNDREQEIDERHVERYTRHYEPVEVSVQRALYVFGTDGQYRSEWAIGRDGFLYSRDPDSRANREWERIAGRHGEPRDSDLCNAIAAVIEAARSTASEHRYVTVSAECGVRAALLRGAVVRP